MQRLLFVFLLAVAGSLAVYAQNDPAIVFNTREFPNPPVTEVWAWGQSAIAVEEGTGPGGTNVAKWRQGDEWGGGWTGWGTTINPRYNLAGTWMTDSLKLTIKCDTGVGPLRAQFESGGSGKRGIVFQPIADTLWHDYSFALRDFVNQDGTTAFDSSSLGTFGLMAEASGIVGKFLRIAKVWTGNPVIYLPEVIFNGKAFAGNITNVWAWGNSTATVEPGGGPVANSNAVKWTQGAGWTGWGTDISPRFDLGNEWLQDSIKMSLKCETGVTQLRVQLESGGTGKRGLQFSPTADDAWHEYVFALKDLVNQDGTTAFDSTSIGTFGVMAENSGVAGKIVRFGKIWTGNPNIDVIPPVAPTGIAASGVNFNNLVTWDEVLNEPGVRYNVFFKDAPWTSTSDSTVEDLPLYNLTAALTNHPLRAPNTDQNVSYYYGVTAKDAAGNESTPAVAASATTTLAKGVPTLATAGPANFVANGTLTEWASITPFDLSVVSGTAHAVPNNPISGDNDLHVKAYLATDAQYLYVAFDVEDDTVAVDTSATDYQQDCPDLYIGFYDWRGKRHSGYTGGATPDYHFRFSKHRVNLDNGGARVMSPGADYIWKEKTLTPGYVVEARILWTTIAGLLPARNDVVFVPREGKRIPMNIVINDRDNAAAGGQRGGIMDYSVLSNDDSWRSQFYWTHTWIGNQWTVGVKQTSDVPRTYQLGQNYPNPFNPTTQINYSIATSGLVTLRLFDVLGREVSTLVNEQQDAGSYTVTVDLARTGKGLSSGVYFYRLESGSFSAVSKMMMLK